MAPSNLPVARSAPLLAIPSSFFPSLKTMVETLANDRSLAAQYARDTVRSCSVSVIPAQMRGKNRNCQEECGIKSANPSSSSRALSRVMGKNPKSTTSAAAILKRIDKRIKDMTPAGKKPPSDRAISLLATGSPDTLRSIRRGVADGSQTGISTETLRKFAPTLMTTAQWLLSEEGQEVMLPLAGPVGFNDDQTPFHIESAAVLGDDPEADTVPVVGYVRAGAEAVMLPLLGDELDRVHAPPGANKNTRALEIRGNSLGELFDRWIVYFDDVRSPITPDLHGKLCILGLEDGRVVVKKVKRSPRNDGYFDLISNTEPTMEGVAVRWAARVRSMEPR